MSDDLKNWINPSPPSPRPALSQDGGLVGVEGLTLFIDRTIQQSRKDTTMNQLPTKAELEAQRAQLLAERAALIASLTRLVEETKEKVRGVR